VVTQGKFQYGNGEKQVENVLLNPLVTYFEHKKGKFTSETSPVFKR